MCHSTTRSAYVADVTRVSASEHGLSLTIDSGKAMYDIAIVECNIYSYHRKYSNVTYTFVVVWPQEYLYFCVIAV